MEHIDSFLLTVFHYGTDKWHIICNSQLIIKMTFIILFPGFSFQETVILPCE